MSAYGTQIVGPSSGAITVGRVISWHNLEHMLVPTGTVGYIPYEYDLGSPPILGAKSEAATLQAFAWELPTKLTGELAGKVLDLTISTAATTISSTDFKLVSASVYESNDGNTWSLVANDAIVKTQSVAGTVEVTYNITPFTINQFYVSVTISGEIRSGNSAGFFNAIIQEA